MATIAFFDCFAGISGDMALGALTEAGTPVEELLAGLRTLPLCSWDLKVKASARAPSLLLPSRLSLTVSATV